MKAVARSTTVWRNQRGMALLITIMTVALLVALTVQFRKTTWDKFLASHHYMSGTQLIAIADSGINIAVAVLQSDAAENEIDSFHDSWAKLANEQFAELFPTGTLKIRIDDLSGRLPINNLVSQQGVAPAIAAETRNVLTRLLLSGVFPVEGETAAGSIVDAIVDWIDADDRESDYGAESGYYRSLKKPYACRNQKLQYIEELLLIKGITPKLLFGAGGSAGLADYLTVYGKDGKININTAARLLIKSLDPLISDELVEKFDGYRKNKDNEKHLDNPNWYRNISGWPEDIVIKEAILTTKSAYFLITATGTLDTLSRSMVAYVERENSEEVNLLVKKVE